MRRELMIDTNPKLDSPSRLLHFSQQLKQLLGLLKEDLYMYNSHDQTFIFDKEKSLIMQLNLCLSIQSTKHVLDFHTTISISHKGLSLKNYRWDVARATIVSQWLEHMQRMLDLESVAYGWLEVYNIIFSFFIVILNYTLNCKIQWICSHLQFINYILGLFIYNSNLMDNSPLQ